MKKLLLLILAFSPAFCFSQTTKPAGRSLFDDKTVGEVRLTLPQNWNSALDSLRIYGEGMLSGSASVDGYNYEGIGVRFRGNNSYQMGLKRNPYSIKLNYTDKEQNHQGYTSLKLSSALRDPSLVREVLSYEIARKYMPAPQANYVKLYINNEYIGLFVNVESIDAAFLRKHFNSDANPFFKAGRDYKEEVPAECKQSIFGSLEYESEIGCYKGNFEMQSRRGWNDLQELTRVLNENPSGIEKVLDVDNTLWMHALNNVMVNLSSYSGNNSINYYLYKDENGRFQPILWDLNLSFGSYKNIGTGSDLELKDLQKLDPMLHADNAYKPLISQLLKDPFYKKVYIAHIRQILADNFEGDRYAARARELQGLIVVPFNEDPYKQYTLSDFNNSLAQTVGRKSKIPGIVELMSKRAKFLKSHPELTALPSEISDINIRARGKYDKEKLNAFYFTAKADRFPKRILIYYRFNSQLPYQVAIMNDENEGALPTGMKAFNATIETSEKDAEEMEYYFVVENAGAVAFFPAHYMYEAKKVKLSDLNK